MFGKGGTRTPFPNRESSQTNKTKYFCFNKGHNHNTDDYIQLRYAIKGLIKRGRLFEYMKGGKKEKEDSPKIKSTSKDADARTNGEEKEVNNGKCQYISAIIGMMSWGNIASKGMMKI